MPSLFPDVWPIIQMLFHHLVLALSPSLSWHGSGPLLSQLSSLPIICFQTIKPLVFFPFLAHIFVILHSSGMVSAPRSSSAVKSVFFPLTAGLKVPNHTMRIWSNLFTSDSQFASALNPKHIYLVCIF